MLAHFIFKRSCVKNRRLRKPHRLQTLFVLSVFVHSSCSTLSKHFHSIVPIKMQLPSFLLRTSQKKTEDMNFFFPHAIQPPCKRCTTVNVYVNLVLQMNKCYCRCTFVTVHMQLLQQMYHFYCICKIFTADKQVLLQMHKCYFRFDVILTVHRRLICGNKMPTRCNR